MKKGLIVFAVVALFGISIPATVCAEKVNSDFSSVQEEVSYEEVKTDALPEEVSAAIEKLYAGYELSKAYLGSDGSYKVLLSGKEKNLLVFFTATGKFLKYEEMSA
ncbi:hypothetical protein ACT3CE_10750 [Marinifilum sp. RC60d5]|uniref:hypothetical protein n=1 Tax=Marinifilum sp. RC60d5 TaxID=3458414 RepID=UPI0040355822